MAVVLLTVSTDLYTETYHRLLVCIFFEAEGHIYLYQYIYINVFCCITVMLYYYIMYYCIGSLFYWWKNCISMLQYWCNAVLVYKFHNIYWLKSSNTVCVCYSHQGPIVFLQEFQNVCNPHYDCHFYISLRWRKFKFPAMSCRLTVSTYGAGKWIKRIFISYPFILSVSLYFLTWFPF